MSTKKAGMTLLYGIATANLRLCRFFGLSEDFWLRMLSSHGLRVAHR